MNKFFVIGNLTGEPVRVETKSGSVFSRFGIAVNRASRDPGEEPEFFTVKAWGALGKNCQKYLHKGRKVAVIGELSHSEWEKDGIKRFSMDINAKEVEFLSKEPESKTPEKESFADITTDDIPF